MPLNQNIDYSDSVLCVGTTFVPLLPMWLCRNAHNVYDAEGHPSISPSAPLWTDIIMLLIKPKNVLKAP